jgi:hypothetical protein
MVRVSTIVISCLVPMPCVRLESAAPYFAGCWYRTNGFAYHRLNLNFLIQGDLLLGLIIVFSGFVLRLCDRHMRFSNWLFIPSSNMDFLMACDLVVALFMAFSGLVLRLYNRHGVFISANFNVLSVVR